MFAAYCSSNREYGAHVCEVRNLLQGIIFPAKAMYQVSQIGSVVLQRLFGVVQSGEQQTKNNNAPGRRGVVRALRWSQACLGLLPGQSKGSSSFSEGTIFFLSLIINLI